MNLIDKYIPSIDGIFKIISTDVRTKEERVLVYEPNLVVSNARFLVRDYTFGLSNPPTKIVLGDMNLTITSNLVEVPPPSLADGILDQSTGQPSTTAYPSLVHKVFEKPFSTKTKVYQSNRPGILYTLDVNEDELNGPDGLSNQIIAEAGIVTDNEQLFARKTFSAIIKSSSIKFTLSWTILF